MTSLGFFALGGIAFSISYAIMYFVCAFFDGWDGKPKTNGKIYQKLFAIGLALKIKQNLTKQ